MLAPESRFRQDITARIRGWPRLRNCPEQPSNARGHCHGERAPERDADCALVTPAPPRAQPARLEARGTSVKFRPPEGSDPLPEPWR